jgi:hypothetical protein
MPERAEPRVGDQYDDINEVFTDLAAAEGLPTPLPPIERGSMSATEDAAAQIRALANSQNVPTAVLDEAHQRLGAFMGEVQGAAGENSQHRDALLGSVQEAQAAVYTAIQACTKLLDDIQTAADGHARG